MPAPNPPSPRDARSPEPEKDASPSGPGDRRSPTGVRGADASTPPKDAAPAGTGARERAALAEAVAQDAQEEPVAAVEKKDKGPSVSCPTCGGALQTYEGTNPHKAGTHRCPRCGVRHRLPAATEPAAPHE